MRAMILLAAAFLPAVALAEPPHSTPVTPASKALDPNERICKDVMTGSRVAPKRICATRAQWEDREREDKAAAQMMQRPVQTCRMMNTPTC